MATDEPIVGLGLDACVLMNGIVVRRCTVMRTLTCAGIVRCVRG